jgi:hypothetical protein
MSDTVRRGTSPTDGRFESDISFRPKQEAQLAPLRNANANPIYPQAYPQLWIT